MELEPIDLSYTVDIQQDTAACMMQKKSLSKNMIRKLQSNIEYNYHIFLEPKRAFLL
jgi:hypothetical protein